MADRGLRQSVPGVPMPKADVSGGPLRSQVEPIRRDGQIVLVHVVGHPISWWSGGCSATIHSPWRRGMKITCRREGGHDGMHLSRNDQGEVAWTGDDPKLTQQELKNQRRS